MGGMQDNASALYVGSDAWVRILFADGMSAAIHPRNDSILYGSIQGVIMYRSVDKGENFSGIGPIDIFYENTPFSGSFSSIRRTMMQVAALCLESSVRSPRHCVSSTNSRRLSTIGLWIVEGPR